MGHGLNPVLIQTLAKIPGLCYFSNFYWKVIHTADPRAKQYPMMHNPDTPASLVLAYILISLVVGPRLMKNHTAPRFVRTLLLLYNVMVIHVNGFLAVALTHHVVSSGYELACQPVEPPGEKGDWVMRLLYGFYCSKIIELVDTLFLVVKKKSNQLTFLHIYHHSTIIAATWIGVKFVPGGTTTIIAMINSWVHVFMYVYYEMMAANVKISRNYKQFLTIMQITQFCFTIVVCSVAMWLKDCGYPKWVLWWLFLYMMSFIILFGRFFMETYKCGKHHDKTHVVDKFYKSVKCKRIELSFHVSSIPDSPDIQSIVHEQEEEKQWENVEFPSSETEENASNHIEINDIKRRDGHRKNTKKVSSKKSVKNSDVRSDSESDQTIRNIDEGVWESLHMSDTSMLNGHSEFKQAESLRSKPSRKKKSYKNKKH